MLVVFLLIFVADTKLIYGYNFVAPLITQTKLKNSNDISSEIKNTIRFAQYMVFTN